LIHFKLYFHVAMAVLEYPIFH